MHGCDTQGVGAREGRVSGNYKMHSIHVYILVCMRVEEHVYMHIGSWRLISSVFLHLIYWVKVSFWIWNSLFQLIWIARLLHGFWIPATYAPGLQTGGSCPPGFHWVLEILTLFLNSLKDSETTELVDTGDQGPPSWISIPGWKSLTSS